MKRKNEDIQATRATLAGVLHERFGDELLENKMLALLLGGKEQLMSLIQKESQLEQSK